MDPHIRIATLVASLTEITTDTTDTTDRNDRPVAVGGIGNSCLLYTSDAADE